MENAGEMKRFLAGLNKLLRLPTGRQVLVGSVFGQQCLELALALLLGQRTARMKRTS
jgi:hypothetical protein